MKYQMMSNSWKGVVSATGKVSGRANAAVSARSELNKLAWSRLRRSVLVGEYSGSMLVRLELGSRGYRKDNIRM